jgi:hypothetical protein
MFATIGLLLLLLQASRTPARAPHPDASPDLDTKLGTTVHDYRMSPVNFVEALTHLASDFEIPMGIEWVDTPAARSRLNFSWQHATVREAIRAIVKSQPGYQMEVKLGIVHIYPSKLIRDRQNILKIKIRDFEVHDEFADVASRKLHELVKLIVYRPKPQRGPGGIAGSGAATLDTPRISLRLQNATVEDVLDALVAASGRKIWIVTLPDDATLTATGYRRTRSLWSKFPIPDDEQPVWDLFHWGDALPADALGKR